MIVDGGCSVGKCSHYPEIGEPFPVFWLTIKGVSFHVSPIEIAVFRYHSWANLVVHQLSRCNLRERTLRLYEFASNMW